MSALPSNPPDIVKVSAEPLQVGPNRITILRDARDTDGHFGMIQYDVIGNFVAPTVLHWHNGEDFTGYVVSGTIRVATVGGRAIEVAAGGSFIVPKNCPFVWSNPSPEPARYVFLYSPGGFENYFREVLAVIAANPQVAPKDLTPKLVPLWEKFGLMSEG